MKKAFISLFTLLTLLVLSITIAFIHRQNELTDEYTKDLYNKKQAQYMAESALNTYMDENAQEINDLILKDYKDHKDDKEKESRWVDENGKGSYEGTSYYVKISYPQRKEDLKFSDVYLLRTSTIEVGDSQSQALAIVKVIDPKKEDGDEYIQIMSKYSY